MARESYVRIDIPESEKIRPGDKCPLCGGKIIEIENTGSDDDELVYLGCENGKEENDGHAEYRGILRGLLKTWGWDL